MLKITSLSLAAAIFFQGAAFADESTDHDGTWRINPAIGLQIFDKERDLDNAATFIGGLEYRYNQRWGSEISIMSSSPELPGGSDVDLLQVGIDGLYFFDGDDTYEAFWILGLANADFDGGIGSELQLHGGAGIRFFLNDQWSMRAVGKVIHGEEDSTLDTLLSVGLSYAFGQTASTKPMAKPMAVDSDGDGVLDSSDQCPNTPAGVRVDAMGCALDGDGDGVADYKDQCPTTPAGREVDERGCKFVLTSTVDIELKVNFPTNSAEVGEEYRAEVEKVAMFLKKYGAVNAQIEGHTDDRGAASYNKSLSQRRADSVKALLVGHYGIDAGRVSAIGYGEEKPMADNGNSDGRRANRRVVAVMEATVEE